ncbi:MAG TPA: MogA/MoaB family molybdenum cofactor biosynthesis protein [Candidatus Koribacter sp.]|jgi:molybdenum cofactor synthesis domain-containing protein
MQKTVAVITVSDRSFRKERPDLSGPAIIEILRNAGFEIKGQEIIPDDLKRISSALRLYAEKVALVITTGGTGVAKRDFTPEATLATCDRLIPGIPEFMRAEGLKKTPMAPLSRAVCGTRGNALVLNLPGNPTGAAESLNAVLPMLLHALELLAGKTDHS